MDWSELERRPSKNKSQSGSQLRIPVKKVAVRKDQIRRLSDGTTIVVPDGKPTRDMKN